MSEAPTDFRTIDFSHEEFSQVIEKSTELIRRGYFTGINFLQSESNLPQNSVIIHFLHDSKNHLDEIKPYIGLDHLIVPRFTCYLVDPEYFAKPNFREEYTNTIFFDSNFNDISIEGAIRNPYGVFSFK